MKRLTDLFYIVVCLLLLVLVPSLGAQQSSDPDNLPL